MKKRRAAVRWRLKPCARALATTDKLAMPQARTAATIQICSHKWLKPAAVSRPAAARPTAPIAMQPLPGTVVKRCAESIVLRM
jgi:hypothetical protein